MKDKQYEQLIKEVRGISSRLADMDNNLARDREQLGDFNVRLSKVEAEIEGFRKSLRNNANQVRDQVVEAVTPIMESADGLAESIDEATIVKVREKKTHWWNKLQRR
jgi:chromosome segregation ATPase